MDWLHLIYQVPAVFTGSVLVSRCLPFKLNARYGTLLTFLVALVVLLMPVLPDMALALIWPVDILHRFHGVSLAGQDPVKVPGVAQVRKRLKPPTFDIKKYATRAYVRPGEEQPESPDDVPESPDDAPGEEETEAPEQVQAVKSYIPEL
jgi:hypothetical protein